MKTTDIVKHGAGAHCYIRGQRRVERVGEGRRTSNHGMEPQDETHRAQKENELKLSPATCIFFFAFFFLFVTVHVYIIVSFVQIQAV